MGLIKEPYFTPDNLAGKSRDMLQALQPLIRPQSASFDQQGAALLVLDMQAYFLDEASHAFIPSAPAILPGTIALMQAFTLLGCPVIATRHVNTPANAGRMAGWWRELITEDNPLSALDPRLQWNEAQVITKPQYDAFLGTRLEEILAKAGIRQLVICGVMTHLCCETTARSAFMRGFEVFFTVDGTATYNKSFHRASLLNLAHGFAVPVLVEDILAALDCRHAP